MFDALCANHYTTSTTVSSLFVLFSSILGSTVLRVRAQTLFSSPGVTRPRMQSTTHVQKVQRSRKIVAIPPFAYNASCRPQETFERHFTVTCTYIHSCTRAQLSLSHSKEALW